jgi:hypothetical protein
MPQAQQQPQRSQDQRRRSGDSTEAPLLFEEDEPAGSTQQKPGRRCWFCNEQHRNAKCPTLTPLSPIQRLKLVIDRRLCKNCLGSNSHIALNCRNSPCGINGCLEKHHSLLHKEESTSSTTINEATSLVSRTGSNEAILSTAVVNLTHNGKTVQVRALFDNGSQVNLISNKVADMLNLPRNQSSLIINGIGNSESKSARGKVSVEISSRVDSTWKKNIDCYVFSDITEDAPSQKIDTSTMSFVKHLKLADDNFHLPGPVDMLLGIQVFLDVLGSVHFKGKPSALQTTLGYIIGGELDVKNSTPPTSQTVLTCRVKHGPIRRGNQETKSRFNRKSKEDLPPGQHGRFWKNNQKTMNRPKQIQSFPNLYEGDAFKINKSFVPQPWKSRDIHGSYSTNKHKSKLNINDNWRIQQSTPNKVLT